jgi:hypothetical protein
VNASPFPGFRLEEALNLLLPSFLLSIITPAPTYHRHSIRMPGYDYTTPGAYFVTLHLQSFAPQLGAVVQDRTWFFGIDHSKPQIDHHIQSESAYP